MNLALGAPSARSRGAALAVLAVALAAAYALKRFYSTASAADLRFVLAPTTWLVEVAGGHDFTFTPRGYHSAALRYLIAPVCAGVNFLVVAFCALVLGLVRPARPAGQNVAVLLGSVAAAYVTTVVANAVRLLLAIPLWQRQLAWAGLGPARVHELAGVAVYLGMLLLLYVAARRLTGGRGGAWIPLLPYVGVVLVAPLLRGAGARPEFRAHAAVVGAAVLAVVLVLAARVRRARRRGGDPAGAQVSSGDGRAGSIW